MGFRPENDHLKLNFQDPDLAGLEVVMESLTVDEYLQSMIRDTTIKPAGERADAEVKALEQFASKLVSWNIEDKRGKPVPATLAGVKTQSNRLITRIMTAWIISMTSVPTTSQLPSGNGKLPSRSEELTLGLDDLSTSPPS